MPYHSIWRERIRSSTPLLLWKRPVGFSKSQCLFDSVGLHSSSPCIPIHDSTSTNRSCWFGTLGMEEQVPQRPLMKLYFLLPTTIFTIGVLNKLQPLRGKLKWIGIGPTRLWPVNSVKESPLLPKNRCLWKICSTNLILTYCKTF